jgi:hypothetical protein
MRNLLTYGIRPSTVQYKYSTVHIQIAIQRGDRLNRRGKLEV